MTALDKIYKINISIAYELRGLETKSLMTKYNFLEVIMCCITFDLSVILIDEDKVYIDVYRYPPSYTISSHCYVFS